MDRTTRQLFDIEPLESRPLMAAIGYRSIDGTGNNLANPDWGSAGTQLLRETLPAYADGVSSPAGTDRVSARDQQRDRRSDHRRAHPRRPFHVGDDLRLGAVHRSRS